LVPSELDKFAKVLLFKAVLLPNRATPPHLRGRPRFYTEEYIAALVMTTHPLQIDCVRLLLTRIASEKKTFLGSVEPTGLPKCVYILQSAGDVEAKLHIVNTASGKIRV